MESIQDVLTELFGIAISAAYPNIPDPPVVIALSAGNPKFGDYQCNSAMQLANTLKQGGKEDVCLTFCSCFELELCIFKGMPPFFFY